MINTTHEVESIRGEVPRRWLGLLAILAATLMNLLDTSIVNVALPSIRHDLGGSYATMQWIAASYTLVLAIGLLTGGRLGDMYGRRRILLSGAGGFIAASIACALAVSPEALIGARVLQAVFAAIMVPQCFGLIRDLFPGDDQAKAWGVFGPAIGLATILGPIIAGLLIKADLFGTGWRMIFLINIPLGAFALAAGARSLPSSKGTRAGGLDVIGMVLAGSGMGLLIYPLVQGRELGWPTWSFAMLGAAVVVLAGFGLHQRSRMASGKIPLVQLGVFGRRSFSAGVLFEIFFFIAIVGFSLGLGLALQLGFGYSPIGASLAMAAWAVGAFIGSAVSSMTAAAGRKVLHIGLAAMIAGVASLYAVFNLAGTSLNSWQLAAPLLVTGAGMGMVFVPMFDIIMGEIQDHEVGSASGSLESIQQLAAALGVAVLGTVFFDRFTQSGSLQANALAAIEHVSLIVLALTIVAFALAFLLPQKARS